MYGRNEDMRRLLGFFLAIMMLIPLQRTVEAAETTSKQKALDNLEMKALNEQVFYIKNLHRYAYNSALFPPAKARRVVSMFNTAIDSLKGKVPVSLYFVESSRSHEIAPEFPADSKFYRYLCQHLHADQTDHLKFTTFEEYCDYFYATDHHWNYRGSYQGYCDIVKMLCGEDEKLLVPSNTVTLPVLFNGSFAKNAGKADSEEYFSLYNFDNLPEYTCYVNGKKHAYDHVKAYLSGKIDKSTFANHYSLCYGGTYALATLETENTEAPNLLLFCNSMGAGVNYILTQHFHKIICVDLRYYAKTYGENFSLQKAIRKYDIDQILILGESQFFIDAKNLVP